MMRDSHSSRDLISYSPHDRKRESSWSSAACWIETSYLDVNKPVNKVCLYIFLWCKVEEQLLFAAKIEISIRRMVSHLKDMLGGTAYFARSTIGLILLARVHVIIHCVSWWTAAIIAPSLDSGQKLIMRLFRVETKPSKHLFWPSGRSDVPLGKWLE